MTGPSTTTPEMADRIRRYVTTLRGRWRIWLLTEVLVIAIGFSVSARLGPAARAIGPIGVSFAATVVTSWHALGGTRGARADRQAPHQPSARSRRP